MPEPLVQLGVPPPVRGAFLALEQLDDEAAEKFKGAITSAAEYGRVAALSEVAQNAFPAEQRDDVEQLVPGILSLRGQLRDSPSEDVADALSRSPDLDLAPEGRARLRDRLVPILESAAVSSTANAMELLTQHSRNFRAARVLTDIRPVFGASVDESPTGAVLVQTLQVDTWDRQGNAETFHVAMDEVDVRELRDVIDRAVSKSGTLRKLLEKTDLTLFELDQGDT